MTHLLKNQLSVTSLHIRVVFVVLTCFFTLPIFSQQFQISHFDENDGYKGLKVYSLVEDSKHNIWFTTELGVYKFDGFTFKEIANTRVTGHEIFDLFCDSEDNIWLGSFSPNLSYINPNEEFIIADTIKNGSLRFIESNDKTAIFFFDDKRQFNCYLKNSNKRSFPFFTDTNSNQQKQTVYSQEALMSAINKSHIDANNKQELFDKLTFHFIINRKFSFIQYNQEDLKGVISDEVFNLLFTATYREIRTTTKNIIFLSEATKVFDRNCKRDYELEKILNQIGLNSSDLGVLFQDSEKNIWITTLNKGFYHIKNNFRKNYTIGDSKKEAFKIIKIKNEIYLSRENQLLSLDLENKKLNKILEQKKSLKKFIQVGETFILVTADGYMINGYKTKSKNFIKFKLDPKIILGQTEDIATTTDNAIWLLDRASIKRTILNNDSITVTNLFKIRRTTSMLETGENLFFTGVNACHKVDKKTLANFTSIKNLNDIHSTSIINVKNEVLVGTYGNGLWKIQGDHAIKIHIPNVATIKNMRYDEKSNQLYLNTDEGIKIYNHENFKLVKSLSNKSGLPTNNISDFLLTDTSILLFSNHGVTVINKTPSPKLPNIGFKEISANNSPIEKLNSIPFNYKNLTFEIESKSLTYLNKIIFNYKLEGFSDEWIQTNTPLLPFNNLSPNKYLLTVFSETPDRTATSKPIEIRFEILPPFWETKLFYVIIISLFIFLSFIIYSYILTFYLRKEKIQKLTHQLSLQSIQAQINPHFFSNVLTGIQRLILKKELGTANEYIHNLGTLSRDIIASSKEDIWPLSKEVALIKNYLDFEKIRFKDRFDFTIFVDEEIDSKTTFVPTMILQPLAENAIKHAFTDSDKKGILTISFIPEKKNIIIKISDNGNGFDESKGSKGYGLKIIKGKLVLIKNIYKKDVSFTIDSVHGEGASFIITIPKNLKK